MVAAPSNPRCVDPSLGGPSHLCPVRARGSLGVEPWKTQAEGRKWLCDANNTAYSGVRSVTIPAMVQDPPGTLG